MWLRNMAENRAKILTATVFLLMAASLLLFSSGGFTGFATTDSQSTTANVSINKNVAIGLTTNLSAGIIFGAVNPGTNNNNASGNYNTGIDICIYDNDNLTNISGASTATVPNINFLFNASNYTVNAPTNNTPQNPLLSSGKAIDTARYYIPEANDSTAGLVLSLRFWLTIPSGQRAGIYNNTIYFLATENETAC